MTGTTTGNALWKGGRRVGGGGRLSNQRLFFEKEKEMVNIYHA